MSPATLDEFADHRAVAATLTARGMSGEESPVKAELLGRAANQLRAIGYPGSTAAIGCFVPGRVEVLGKHTDYAGGRSLICAAERGFCAVAVPRPDPVMRIQDVIRAEETEFTLTPGLVPTAGHWSNYPMTVARRLARNFAGPLRGLDLALASDLPPAAGMSSSSAMIVMTFLMLAHRNDLFAQSACTENIHSLQDLAGYLGTIENGQSFGRLIGDRGVGTFGGSEDHTAILCCRPGELTLFSYCPVRHEQDLTLPDDHVLAIGVSGIVAEKTGAAMERYNRAALRARAICRIWNEAGARERPHLAAIVSSGAGAAERVRSLLSTCTDESFAPAELRDRFNQFVAESEELIPAAAAALRQGDLKQFGAAVHRSQELGVRLLGNQVAETEFLAAQAERLGAVAASAFGAGFGGSVWSLVPRDSAAPFLTHWRAAYAQAFPQQTAAADFFLTRPGPAAGVFNGSQSPFPTGP